jgi:uncharacterized protein YbgA (DUF1722 family)
LIFEEGHWIVSSPSGTVKRTSKIKTHHILDKVIKQQKIQDDLPDLTKRYAYVVLALMVPDDLKLGKLVTDILRDDGQYKYTLIGMENANFFRFTKSVEVGK